MSGLEALGLACNIFQVISFGRETASLVKRVYRDGTVDDALEANAKDLAQLAKHVQTLEVPKSPTKQEHQLLEIAKKCQAVARDLTEEIAFIVGHKKKGSLAATIKVAAKANWRKRRLDTMERKLNDAERLMQSGLLARICQKADAMHVDLKSLDISLQHFLGQYQQGHRDTSDLISTEMFRTRNHVTYESHKATDQIRSMVDQQSAQLDTTIRSSNRQVSAGMAALSLDRDREAKRQRFLASFKFPRMNERRNQVSESCEGTFQWIFADDMGMLEDPDNDTEWTNTESESFKMSGDSCYQADDSDWKDDSAKRNSAPEQDDGIRWDSFIDWLRSGSKIFWCSGKPGCGKSTLMRYIRSDPRTTSALEVWSPGALLVSHFFWRPGSLMQQSIRGMFCSLLHQLLASGPSILDRSRLACSSAGEKDSDTDWSTKELQSLCFNTIEQYNRPICLFLDGLDEVSSDDGVVRLIETIHDLGAIPNVKVCVSSRPEYLIEKHLGRGRYPFIHLQDLTNQDLRTYIQSHTNFPPKFKMRDFWGDLEDPITVLVDKAEGVFLWLCLAIQSLNRGLDHENNLDELEQRIRSLPTGLSNLYKDMWARLNDDQLLYRQKAALYLRQVIANQSPNSTNSFGNGLNAFAMMLITTSMADRILEQHGHMIHPSTLITACHRTQSEVLVRCSGLLELPESTEVSSSDTVTPWNCDQYDSVMPHIISERTFQFIHRSACDFLLDTPEGGEILSHCTLSNTELQRQVILAWVAICQLVLIKPDYSWFTICEDGCLNELDWIFSSIKTTISDSLGQPGYRKEDWMHLMKACERLCRSGRLVSIYGQPINIFGHVSHTKFYTIAARNGLLQVAFSDVEYLDFPPEILSQLLFETCCHPSLHPRTVSYADSSRLAAELLKHGADPNAKFTTGTFPEVLETPLSVILRNETHVGYRSRETWLFLLHTLDCFADHGVDFQQCVFTSFHYGFDRCIVAYNYSPILTPLSRWAIYTILPAAILIAAAAATYRTRGLSFSQEFEHLLSLLGSSVGAHGKSEARVIGLQDRHSSQPNFCEKLSPEDSDHLCEFLIKKTLLGFSQLENPRVLCPFEAEHLGKMLEAVLEKSELSTKGIEDHLIDIGLAEAKIYVDDDGVCYSQDAAEKMMPEWIVNWLDGRRLMS
ncbi:uncharacterized protein BDZ83DRAFT_623479 [Colletotrichum acutatum]|uniref:NACHT domain-containing protein n=1 Tax=Glomerella acutata TaxID=27357 RepID=A0AAD8ULP7_GLOAC|nr:uncharacterized protein BDZ83DRAFT_623479 [Colletotrichum acutatum]KAK1724250.1 hypothetical protein BDZ83DRAFT_623479 [Colletotrichum acutatum]